LIAQKTMMAPQNYRLKSVKKDKRVLSDILFDTSLSYFQIQYMLGSGNWA
jgi:hypothetical protein